MHRPKTTILTTSREVSYLTFNGENTATLLSFLGLDETLFLLDDVRVPYLKIMINGLSYSIKKGDTIAKFSDGEIELWNPQEKRAIIGEESNLWMTTSSSKDNDISKIFTYYRREHNND